MAAVPPNSGPGFTSRQHLERLFPNCAAQGVLDITSEEDMLYNCVAWSLDISGYWLQPMTDFGPVRPWAIWPDPDARGSDIDTYIRMYRSEGFVRATHGRREPGFHKIVLYWQEESRRFLHVAKQGPDGRWMSKLGPISDVVHSSPDTLGPPGSPGGYGTVWGYMKRQNRRAADDTPLKRAIREVENHRP